MTRRAGLREQALAALLRALRDVRRADDVMAALAMLEGFLHPATLARARVWAGAHAHGPVRRWRLVCRLLAHRGRHLSIQACRGIPDAEAFRRRTRVEGAEHLAAARERGGVILLGFHLGMGGGTPALKTHGHVIYGSGEGTAFAWPAPPPGWTTGGSAPRPFVVWTNDAEAASGLYTLHRLLREGRTVGILGDARTGREAFRIALPGRVMVLRAGWFDLRRRARAATLPVLTHLEGRTVVVRIHPPLPPPDVDVERDREVCHDALAGPLAEHVRRHPEQCPVLALQADEGP